MNVPSVTTQNLTCEFGPVRALENLSLSVPAGRLVAVLGPNGAGKTTLFRILAGLIEPTSGEARTLGYPSRGMPADAMHRLAVMCDRHEPPRWARLSHLLSLQQGASPQFDRTFAEYLLLDHGLKLNAFYGALSKGQRRWALVTLALSSGADLLLLDEPADGLDTTARRDLYDHLREYVNERDATVLVATHIIGDIERIADDVMIIDHGRLMLHESVEELRDHVREIEFLDTRATPPMPAGVDLIGRMLVNGATVAWVRHREPDELDFSSLTGKPAQVRSVNLETLYLAMTQHGVGYMPSHLQTEASS